MMIIIMMIKEKLQDVHSRHSFVKGKKILRNRVIDAKCGYLEKNVIAVCLKKISMEQVAMYSIIILRAIQQK